MAEPLLGRVAAGDAAAVEQCIDRYGGLVWSLARRHCRGEAEAEDAVQDVFIELWRKAPSYSPELGSELTFVAMIARRRLIDGYRRQSRRLAPEPLGERTDVAAPTSPDAVETADEAARAAEALRKLSAAQQQVLELTIYHGLSYPEVAERLGLPLGTVKTHARRGLIRLRELLADEPSAAGLGSAT